MPVTVSASSTRMTSTRDVGISLYDVVLVAFLIAFACVYVLTAATVEAYGSDTSIYFELARSLLHEHRYWFNFEPHTLYPPGFPLFLAGLMFLAGESFPTLVKLSILVDFIGLLGLYYLLKLQRGPEIASAIVVLVATSYVLYFWSTVGLHSEGLYFTTSIYALLCVELGNRAKQSWVRLSSYVLVALLAAYLVLVRSIGITFVAGLILWIVYPLGFPSTHERDSARYRLKAWFPAVILPIAVFFAWNSWAGQHAAQSRSGNYMESYAQQILKEDPHRIDSPNISFTKIPVRMIKMLFIRTANAARMVFNLPGLFLSWRNPATLLFLGILVLGFASCFVREGSLRDCYVLAYGGMLLLHPFDEGTRFLQPIQPFVLLYALAGLETAYALLTKYLAKGASRSVEALFDRDAAFSVAKGGLTMALLITGLYQTVQIAGRNLHPEPSTFTNARTVEASKWVADHTRETDVIMDEQFAILHRLTGRRTDRFPLTTDPHFIRERILASGAAFVVVLDERQYEYYVPSVMNRFETLRRLYPHLFTPVYTFGSGTIYKVERG